MLRFEYVISLIHRHHGTDYFTDPIHHGTHHPRRLSHQCRERGRAPKAEQHTDAAVVFGQRIPSASGSSADSDDVAVGNDTAGSCPGTRHIHIETDKAGHDGHAASSALLRWHGTKDPLNRFVRQLTVLLRMTQHDGL